jgi:diaminohydroxyphosphoribosylaminopyrimidine deaminase / 5-amino-6-(5-phosphoribosylamino)uracil reductase
MQPPDRHTDELFMRRALQLAASGLGRVSPNPMVGCVIVYDNRIIGEGWHQKYGEAHAEVNAVNAVQEKALLKDSTVYVNLEPCSHFGKTPPCADMLIREKVKKVVIANLDTNPLVAGEGMTRLAAAGIAVQHGVLQTEGRELNKRFFTFMEEQRPYFILKWAQTADGFIAREDFDSKWISNELSRQRVHKWRAEEDAVLVGKSTAQYDNPVLNVRHWTGRDPVRIVIDANLELSQALNLFDHSQKTFCYNLVRHEEHPILSYIKLERNNFLKQLVAHLYQQKIQSVIIEGGTKTIQSFVEKGLWDEARIFTSQKTFGKGIAAPVLKGRLVHEEEVQTDVLKVLYRT